MRVRTQERRDQIVEAAATLFEEVGYEAASMNELAKRLGGSKATLYGYFPSKESLLVAVVQAFATDHLADATQDVLQDIEGQCALRPTLMRFGERMLQVLTNDRSAIAIHSMILAEAGRSNVGQLFHEAGPSQSAAALTKLMAAAMERGELRQTDPRIAGMQFSALLTAEVSPRLYQQNPPALALDEIQQVVSRAVDMFLMGAVPRP